MVTQARAATRFQWWTWRHPVLWCIQCQAFGAWRQTEAGDVQCTRCERVLIPAPVFEGD